MPINSITINNFQSIKKAKVDFPAKLSGGSVTTIIGPSSTGKSALLRALKMLARNTSSAPVRVQDGATKATVSADVEGVPVRVERGKSLSTYFIGTEKYSKAGTSVPQSVQDIIKFDSSAPDLHFSFQFDRPYLLDESGTTVSSLIGRLTHANTLRLAVKEGNRRSLESSRLLKTRLSDLEKARENLLEYSWVNKSAEDVTIASELVSTFKALNTKTGSIGAAVSKCQTTKARYLAASQSVSQYPDVSEQVESAETLLGRCTKVYSVLTMIEDKKYFAAKLLSTKPVSFDAAEISMIDSKIDEISNVNNLVADIRTLATKYTNCQSEITELQEASTNVQEVYDRTLRRLGRCPVCGKDTSPGEG